MGTASFAQFFPAVLFGPLGGSIADRYPRRSVLLVAQAAMAAIALALWALWASGSAQPSMPPGPRPATHPISASEAKATRSAPLRMPMRPVLKAISPLNWTMNWHSWYSSLRSMNAKVSTQ